MDVSNFKLLKEDGDSYHVAHPNGKPLVVSKAGLSAKAHAIIKKLNEKTNMPEGGEVPADAPQESAQIPEALRPSEPVPASMPMSQSSVAMPTGDQKSAPAADPSNPQQMLEEKDKDVKQSLEEQKQANVDVASAKSAESSAASKAIDANQKQIEAMPSQQQLFDQYQAKGEALEKAYRDKQIDPQRFYNNMSTSSRVGAAIGMLISGFGSGVSGQPNMALEMMKRNVDQDIEAQRIDKEGAKNLWQMNKETMGSALAADAATKNQMYLGVKYKIEQAALQSGTPMALAQAKLANSQIDQQIAANNYQLSLIHTGMGAGADGKFVGQDPSVLVPQLIKEPGAQAKALEEIKNATNVGQNGPKIMDAFDKASKENTIMSTGAGMLRTPGSVMALHQLMLPNFKAIDGTVRQAAMDESFHNLTPSPGDTDEKIAQKRQALQDWLHSEAAAPTAKAHGIDLSKFSNTAVQNQAGNPKIRAFMKANPGVRDEAQAEQILKKHGKL